MENQGQVDRVLGPIPSKKIDVEALLKDREKVNHPLHYGGENNPYEAIKVIEAWKLGFCLGNTVKYIARAGKKGDTIEVEIEDLKKALWYLDRRIKQLEEMKRCSQ